MLYRFISFHIISSNFISSHFIYHLVSYKYHIEEMHSQCFTLMKSPSLLLLFFKCRSVAGFMDTWFVNVQSCETEFPLFWTINSLTNKCVVLMYSGDSGHKKDINLQRNRQLKLCYLIVL